MLFEMCYKELPDNWDALWMGGSEKEAEPYSLHLKRLYVGTGGYAIIFKETMYDELIFELKKENYVADVVYMHLQKKYNCFRTWNNIIFHLPGISTIKKEYVNYPKLNAP